MNGEIDMEKSSDSNQPDELSAELREALDGLRGEITKRFPAREPLNRAGQQIWEAVWRSAVSAGIPG